MKRCLILLALFTAACGSQPTSQQSAATPAPMPIPMSQPPITPANTAAQRNGPVVPSAQPTAAQQKSVEQAPAIPKGARFTIFCESFTGDDHVQASTQMKNILMSNAKVKGWYVIHQDGQSTLYHGYYSDFDVNNAADAAAKKDAQRAQNDKKLVEALPNPLNQSQKLFPRALFVSLDSPDPDAPAEWNLVNSGGAYSVEIAAYSGFERKQAAVESVRDARKMNIPAYYWHGPSYSHVCIGSWPATAVVEQAVEQVNAIPQGNDVFVDVQGGAIPAELKNNLLRQGRNVQVVVPKVKIVDQTLLETLRAYPEHSVDGIVQMETVVDPGSRQKIQKPKHSMLVRVPAADASMQASSTPDDSREPTLIQPNPASRNNLGARLRGLNE